jgi:hypothetical protein
MSIAHGDRISEMMFRQRMSGWQSYFNVDGIALGYALGLRAEGKPPTTAY